MEVFSDPEFFQDGDEEEQGEFESLDLLQVREVLEAVSLYLLRGLDLIVQNR